MNHATTTKLLGVITEFENRVALILQNCRRTTHLVSIYARTHAHTHTHTHTHIVSIK